MDDSVGMVMIAPDESPAEAKRPSAPETAKVADAQSKRAAVSSREDRAKGAKDGSKRTVGKFTVQLQAFQSRQEAEKFQAVMKADGYNTFLQKAELEGKGTWYRIRFGRFMTQQEAQQFKARFERDQGFVTTVMALGD